MAFSGPLLNYMHCMLYLIICMYVTYLRKYLFILFIIYVETLYWAALGLCHLVSDSYLTCGGFPHNLTSYLGRHANKGVFRPQDKNYKNPDCQLSPPLQLHVTLSLLFRF